MGKGFDDYADIILADESKVASQSSSVNSDGGSILEQLAAELNDNTKVAADVTAPAAPANEGEVTPAESSVTGINSEVQAATEAVAYPQTTIAGGNPQEVAAGEVPQSVKPSEVETVSAGDGKATTPNLMHKTPTAMAEGADASTGAATGEKTASKNETPEEAGVKIANAFYGRLEELQKQANLAESIEILKTASLTADHVDGYDFSAFVGETEKVASEEVDYLQKIASGLALTEDDIIGAAEQVLDFEKEAAQADAEGRELAHQYYQEEMAKQAGQEEVSGEVSFVDQADEAAKQEKIASLLEDPKTVEAVKYLKGVGAIELLS
jgi:hypothetical protein